MVQSFLSIALPICLTFIGTICFASWSRNKGLDEIVKRLDKMMDHLLRIDARLAELGERLTRVEERTSPLASH